MTTKVTLPRKTPQANPTRRRRQPTTTTTTVRSTTTRWSPSSSPTSVPFQPEETVELDVMGWEFPIITAFAAELEECTDGNYELNYQFLDSTEARSAMTQDAATGAPTFELYQGSNALIGELANQGFLMPLNDLVDKYCDEFDLDQIDQAFWDMASIDGQIYAVPMVSNTMPVLQRAGSRRDRCRGSDHLRRGLHRVRRHPGCWLRHRLPLHAVGRLGLADRVRLGPCLLGVSLIDPTTGQPNFQPRGYRRDHACRGTVRPERPAAIAPTTRPPSRPARPFWSHRVLLQCHGRP